MALEKKRAPTMRDVAQAVGVSVQTVSAVINNKPGITEETRTRVQEAILRLGYRPYSIARSLRTRRTGTIALVVSDIANPSFATMASAAEDYAHQFGYSLIVYNTHDDREREKSYFRSVTQRWIDGVMFVAAEDHLSSPEAFQFASFPSVAIDRIPEHYSGLSVTLNNIEAGRMAAEHLLELGHTRIAHISGPLKLRLVRDRITGFIQAFEARCLTPLPCPAGMGDWTCASGYTAMQHILKTDPLPTAVFAANDRMAIGAIQACYETGVCVPRDMSVVGVDDIEVAAFQTPPLTTIRQPFVEFGTLAVRLLLEVIETGRPSQPQIVIEPLLIERQSTAPVKH
ncbi:MAG: LacI family DNA-binding transcriptional regulator [Anaerolineae bacterium]|nr:LacI family DNA-binding transcriptional regulator [Anaerolineae bacterium]